VGLGPLRARKKWKEKLLRLLFKGARKRGTWDITAPPPGTKMGGGDQAAAASWEKSNPMPCSKILLPGKQGMFKMGKTR